MLAHTVRFILLVALSFSAASEAAESISATARQSDGKIVVAAEAQNAAPGAPSSFLVGRLNADGNLDTSFGQSGWATVVADATYATFRPTAIAVATSGRIVVALESDGLVGLAALTSAGAIDTAFGSGGMFIDAASAGYRVNALYAAPPSMILNSPVYLFAAGAYKGSGTNAHWDTALLRYGIDGYKDVSFGVNGAVRLALSSADNEARAMAGTSFGSIFLAGYARNFSNSDRNILVARVNLNGALETTFGDNGRLIVDYNGRDDEAFGMHFDTSITRLFVMGRVGLAEGAATRGLFAILRLTYDGAAHGAAALQTAEAPLEAYGDSDAAAMAYVPLQSTWDEYLIGGTSRNIVTGESRMVVLRCPLYGLCGNALWGTNGLGTAVMTAAAGQSDVMRGMYRSDEHASVVLVGTRASTSGLSMVRGEFSTGTGYLLSDYSLVVPETTISSGPAALSTSRLAHFVVSSDTGTSFECSLDGQAFAACSTMAYENVADGAHVFRVRAVNYAGADPTPAEWSWSVDATVPETTIVSRPPAVTASTSAVLVFSSADAGATFECALDGAPFAACASPVTLFSLVEGAHTFTVRARDAAGNVEATPEVVSWIVDSIAPETFITGAPAEFFGGMTLVITFASNEASATFECAFDNAPFSACTSPKQYSVGSGPHQFFVRARDAAGNVDATPAERHWLVDNAPPVTNIFSSPSPQTSAATATFTFGSSKVPVTFQCSIDGTPFVPCASPVILNGVPEGLHMFSVRATDANGTVEQNPPVISWRVDTDAPETVITSGPAEVTSSTSASFTLDADESVLFFECKLDGGTFAPCAASVTYWGLAAGPHRLDVRAYDLASNVDLSPSTFLWTIDVTPPNTTVTSAAPSPNSTVATFTFESNEAGATFLCRVDVNRFPSAVFTACTSPVVLTALVTGQHVFEVRARDAAGNVDASPVVVSWNVSSGATTPLDTMIQSGPSGPTASNAATFTFTATQTGVVFECRINTATFQPCTSPKSYSFANGSTQTFAVRARRTATGEVDATPATSTWTVDLTAPTVAIVSGPPSSTSATSATFGFSASEAATFECKLDGGTFVACPNPATFSALAPGNHGLMVRARDIAGNVGPSVGRGWVVN